MVGWLLRHAMDCLDNQLNIKGCDTLSVRNRRRLDRTSAGQGWLATRSCWLLLLAGAPVTVQPVPVWQPLGISSWQAPAAVQQGQMAYNLQQPCADLMGQKANREVLLSKSAAAETCWLTGVLPSPDTMA